jgi:Dyp-type peroxidase family
MLLLGSDSCDRLALAEQEFIAEAQAAGCSVIYRERGAKLPGEIEHFGFRDGISQPGPRGLLAPGGRDYVTPRYFKPGDPLAVEYAKPGQPLVWPGQFVFGYEAQRADPLVPGARADGGEAWMKNGSYLVFRRLRQEVPAFWGFVRSIVPTISQAFGQAATDEFAAALLVGRWKDGTPLVMDSAAPNPQISNDALSINHFKFDNAVPAVAVVEDGIERTISGAPGDPLGLRCPFVAHIRKVNPRDRTTNRGAALPFQILRRGIPFGPRLTAETANDERGLLFLAFIHDFAQRTVHGAEQRLDE